MPGIFRNQPATETKKTVRTSQSTIPQKAKFLQNNEPILTNEK
jgi:hypothetical protein